jgi:hypothetical protein
MDALSALEGLSRDELLSKFEELQQRWKVEPTPEGFSAMLGLFEVSSATDLVPAKIDSIYKLHWNTFLCIRHSIERIEEDSKLRPEDVENFNRFQQNIYHAYTCVMDFMRSANCNDSYPAPKTPSILFWHTPMDVSKCTPYHSLILYCLGRLDQMRLRRADISVYEQVFMGHHPTHAWSEKCTIEEIVRQLCDKENHFEMWKIANTGGNFRSCVEYLTHTPDTEFPDLIIKRRVWSFSDGIYDATNDTFKYYGEPINEHLVSCKIIWEKFTPAMYTGDPHVSLKHTYDTIGTPLFDSIFQPQNWDSEMIKWMFTFIGRLFYEVNEKDAWQVIPFMKGVAGTGKSTVIRIVQMMYSINDVGIISNNIEKKFGLSTIFNKTIFVVPELKGDFAMDQADFQSMVTGEELSLAVKNKNPVTGAWKPPGIMAGNESAGWEDKSGSISRRIVVFDFPNKVPLEQLNPKLLDQIKDTELPKIIRKSALAYNESVSKFGHGDIWAVLPARICEEKKRLQYSTNPLYAFVNSDCVIMGPSEYTIESIFIAKLKEFAALKFPSSVITFTPDYYSYIFSDFKISICKDSLPWPPSNSGNVQTQNYIMGCKICD